MVHFKKIVKKFCPPIIKEMIVNRRNKFGYFGDFASWEDAKNASEGYDKKIILDKVEESTRKVKTGRAVYERDSITSYRFWWVAREYIFSVRVFFEALARDKMVYCRTGAFCESGANIF